MDDESVVVYVAPTKPLQLQVSQEVQARFNKTYKKSNTVLFGDFASTFRENEGNCQILVTMPEAFEIMLNDAK